MPEGPDLYCVVAEVYSSRPTALPRHHAVRVSLSLLCSAVGCKPTSAVGYKKGKTATGLTDLSK